MNEILIVPCPELRDDESLKKFVPAILLAKIPILTFYFLTAVHFHVSAKSFFAWKARAGVCFLEAKSGERPFDGKLMPRVDDRHIEGLFKPLMVDVLRFGQMIQLGAVIEAIAAFKDFAEKK